MKNDMTDKFWVGTSYSKNDTVKEKKPLLNKENPTDEEIRDRIWEAEYFWNKYNEATEPKDKARRKVQYEYMMDSIRKNKEMIASL